MNEAFSDLSVLGDYDNRMTEVLPFINSLTKNTQKGWMYSSVKGGNTANTEFEFLTGLSMYFLPTGSIALSAVYQIGIAGTGRVSYLPSVTHRWLCIRIIRRAGTEIPCMMILDLKKSILKMISEIRRYLRTYISDWTTYQKIIETIRTEIFG